MNGIPDWIQSIVSPSQFIPHGHCYLWQPHLVWLHVLSDMVIAIAYFSIPIMLIYFVRKREDVPFPGIFLLFSLFIITCGTTHLMAVWTLWHPAYWLSGVIKAITAVVSLFTALTLLPTIPVALALPSPEKLRELNQTLEARVEERTAAVKESERRWQSFLQRVRLMVVGLDCRGRIEYANPYFLEQMGYGEDAVLGLRWIESFVPGPQQPESRAVFDDIFNRENHPNYRSSLVTSTQEERIISWNSALLQDAQGQGVGILSIGEDVTDQAAVARMKNEFISVVSHELRTPLTAIHGALDLLSSGLVDPQSEKGEHVFSIAVDNSDRLVKLVNDILELERLESGKLQLTQVSVSVKELVHRAYEAMELMAERSGITLEVDSPDLLLWADGDRIIQVLINLVGNAIKFSETLSTVSIVVEEEEEASAETKTVRFTVIDQGRGIPPDKLVGIFERFHQVDASDSRRKGGTGLGLAICRSIVQQHGGEIWAESTLGQGSRFYFTLPLQPTTTG